MLGEYVRIITSDGYELQGFFSGANVASPRALVHIHGLAGNFYENPFIEAVCRATVAAGWNFLTMNMRGHDYIADLVRYTASGQSEWTQIGAAFERFEDCLSDISAAVDFLASRNCSMIVFEGHSTGALRIIYYLSKTQDPRIVGLALVSAADDFGLQKVDLGARYEGVLDLARRMVAEGKSDTLMPRDSFEYVVSAGTYLDLFGPESKHAIFEFSNPERGDIPELAAITVPVLAVMGTEGEAIVGDSPTFLSALEGYLENVKSFQAKIIQGAPHRYLGYEDRLSSVIASWLRERSHRLAVQITVPVRADAARECGSRPGETPRRSEER